MPKSQSNWPVAFRAWQGATPRTKTNRVGTELCSSNAEGGLKLDDKKPWDSRVLLFLNCFQEFLQQFCSAGHGISGELIVFAPGQVDAHSPSFAHFSVIVS